MAPVIRGETDNAGFAHAQERGQHPEPGRDESGVPQPRGSSERVHEFRPAIGIDRVVSAVRAERYRIAPRGYGQRHRDVEQERVPVRHHGRPHRLVGVVPVRNGHARIGERAARQQRSDRPQLSYLVFQAETGGNLTRAIQFPRRVTLPVIHRQHPYSHAVSAQMVHKGDTVQATGDDRHCRRRPHVRRCRSLVRLAKAAGVPRHPVSCHHFGPPPRRTSRIQFSGHKRSGHHP